MQAASLWRRMAALFYDLLITFSLLVLAGFIFFFACGKDPSKMKGLPYTLYLFSIIVVYFWGFWVKGGQTLGMLAWKIQLVRKDGRYVTSLQALFRLFLFFILVPLTLGLAYCTFLLDPKGRSLPDIFAGTMLIKK